MLRHIVIFQLISHYLIDNIHFVCYSKSTVSPYHCSSFSLLSSQRKHVHLTMYVFFVVVFLDYVFSSIFSPMLLNNAPIGTLNARARDSNAVELYCICVLLTYFRKLDGWIEVFRDNSDSFIPRSVINSFSRNVARIPNSFIKNICFNTLSIADLLD